MVSRNFGRWQVIRIAFGILVLVLSLGSVAVASTSAGTVWTTADMTNGLLQTYEASYY
jgi:hypothetical protein